MKSIKSLYKIGHGPSSSHTVGPYNAAQIMLKRFPDADSYEVTLYGSLAYTGEGHSTGKAIVSGLPGAKVYFDKKTVDLPHPNTMRFVIRKDGVEICNQRVFSIGGGSIRFEDESSDEELEVYPHQNFSEMMEECKRDGISILDFIHRYENASLWQYLEGVWFAMQRSVEEGLNVEGILPGGLEIQRKAKLLYNKRCYNEASDVTMNRLIAAYAYAVAEQNASEGIVVTAPTCGAAAVIPAILYYMSRDRGYPDPEIIDTLAVAGLLGNVIRTNGSISGAECGCQAEIGSACSMAAGGLAFLNHLSIDQIEYAAEVAMEHNLGLTCDPVRGLVQIPCIERNAVAAMRALSAVNLSRFLSDTRKISFDAVIHTMYQTGIDLNEKYRETSHGGLAEIYEDRKKHGARVTI